MLESLSPAPPSAGGVPLSLTVQTRLPQQVELTEGIFLEAEVKPQMKGGGAMTVTPCMCLSRKCPTTDLSLRSVPWWATEAS